MRKIVLIILCLMPSLIFGQHLFPEKFKGCITDQFALESDTAKAKILSTDFIHAVTGDFDEKTMSKIEGLLTMQILVDLDGNSCLLSVENKTNFTAAKLKLKENIDKKLVWGKPSEKVSAIIVLEFHQGTVTYKRLGLNGNTGWHTIYN